MKRLETLESTLGYAIVERPADVLEKRVVQELLGTLAHPFADFVYANAPNIGTHVSVAVNEHRLEYEINEILNLVLVVLYLFALLREHLNAIVCTLSRRFLTLIIVLTLICILLFC
jgi:hypothetical protein